MLQKFEKLTLRREWISKHFITSVGSQAVCWICQDSISGFKKHIIKRHFSTNHPYYALYLSSQKRDKKALKLRPSFMTRQTFLQSSRPSNFRTKASYLPSNKMWEGVSLSLMVTFWKTAWWRQLSYCAQKTKFSSKASVCLHPIAQFVALRFHSVSQCGPLL